jgi:cell pole-organizing protein PopZ
MADNRSEPSMDEILSSIKRIIADDDRGRPATKRAKSAAREEEEEEEEEVLELTTAEENAIAEDRLLDDGKAQNLRHSFSALQTLSEPGVAPQIVRSGETSLEGLTRELLRPMLKDWLDTHLPPIVEAMVEREITRITKKG